MKKFIYTIVRIAVAYGVMYACVETFNWVVDCFDWCPSEFMAYTVVLSGAWLAFKTGKIITNRIERRIERVKMRKEMKANLMIYKEERP